MTATTSGAVVGPYYKVTLLAVIAIFILSLITYAALGVYLDSPTANAQKVFDVLDFVVKSTLGAILGLVGGKVS
jgi:hypothetical protein